MPQCDCWAHRSLIPKRKAARATQIGPDPVPHEPPATPGPTVAPEDLDPHGDHTADGDGPDTDTDDAEDD